MSVVTDDKPRERFHINRSITIGDIIVSILFVGSAVTLYSSIDKRVSNLELQAQVLESRIREKETNTKDNFLELKSDLKQLQTVVQQLVSDIRVLSTVKGK